MVNKHVKIRSTSLILRGMQIKTTMRSHPSGWPLSKRTENSVGEDVEKSGSLYTVGGNGKWCSHCGKLKIELSHDPAILLLGIHLKELKAESQIDICTLHCSIIYKR